MCDFIFEHRERQRKKHFCLLRCLSAFATPIKLYFRCVFKLLPYVALAFFSLLLQETRRQAVLYPNFLRPMPRLMCGNRSNQEIADILGVKVATVKTHVIHILQKLGVKRRGDAKEIAQKLHIIEF